MKQKRATTRRGPARARTVGTRWQDRIAVDPAVCHGQACIKGTRIMVSVILDSLAEGDTPDDLARDFDVAPEDVVACLHYAAILAREEILPLAVGE